MYLLFFHFLYCLYFIYSFNGPVSTHLTFFITEFINYSSENHFVIILYFYVSLCLKNIIKIFLAAFPFFKQPRTNLTLNLFYFIELSISFIL